MADDGKDPTISVGSGPASAAAETEGSDIPGRFGGLLQRSARVRRAAFWARTAYDASAAASSQALGSSSGGGGSGGGGGEAEVERAEKKRNKVP